MLGDGDTIVVTEYLHVKFKNILGFWISDPVGQITIQFQEPMVLEVDIYHPNTAHSSAEYLVGH
jgi:hypothetical protein